MGDPDDIDNPGLTTNWLPFLSQRAGKTREWNPPTKGEQVVLLCPMGDPAQGLVLCGLNSDAAPAPSNSADKHRRVYPDDAAIEYDHARHALTATLPAGAIVLINAPGSVTVKTTDAIVDAKTILLDCDQTTVTGAMLVKGPFEFQAGMTGRSSADAGATMQIDGRADFTGDVTSEGKSLPHHHHVDDGRGEPV